MKEIFVREDSVYNLRCMFRFKFPTVLTAKNGLETLSFRGSQIWNSLPNNLKELNSVAAFRRAIKGWNGEDCNCRICSVTIAGVSTHFYPRTYSCMYEQTINKVLLLLLMMVASGI